MKLVALLFGQVQALSAVNLVEHFKSIPQLLVLSNQLLFAFCCVEVDHGGSLLTLSGFTGSRHGLIKSTLSGFISAK